MTGIFVTGTDTDVGKTVASAYLMLATGSDYWKPIQSGLDGETDTAAMRRLTDLPAERFHASAYALRSPLSPHEAARRDGLTIALDMIVPPKSKRPLIVEGAGGVLVPINGEALMVDLMGRLGLPAVLVARTRLGTINHTLLSIEALRARRIRIAGVILNGPPDEANRRAIEVYGGVRIIAEIPHLDPLGADSLSAFARTHSPQTSEVV